VFTDTVFGKVKSLSGNTCTQVYGTTFHWCMAVPMEAKADVHFSLDELFQKCGIPSCLIPNNAKELTQGLFTVNCMIEKSNSQ